MMRLAIVASHVIQYQDPFFRLLARDPAVDLTVIYCSRHGLDVFRDADMATTLRWDIDMLAYEHRFLRNASRDLNGGFWRLVNPGIVPALARGHYDAVIFMTGWGAFTPILGMLTCRLFHIPFFLYGDSSFPPPENSLCSRIRARIMRLMMKMTNGFMVSGSLNADYYRHYGADPQRFFLLPWAVDNERFAAAGTLDAGERETLRSSYSIAGDAIVFLFSAKLIARKDPFALLKAFERMQRRDGAAIIFMGDGVLRPALEQYAAEHDPSGVHFTGFVNQTALPKLYAMADVFVLPSLIEPRGAVINEAMAVGLPVITTDRCGSIGDIVLDGENAIVYPAGNVEALAAAMDRLAGDATLRSTMGRRSREIIATWDYARGIEGVKEALRWLDARKRT